jgi:hypothetical protein
MSDFPSAPRGRGRHWRDGGQPTRYARGQADTTSGYLPRIEDPLPPDEPYPPEDDGPRRDLGDGLYRVPVPGDPEALGPEISQTRLNRERRIPVPQQRRPPDLVVPRVYLEPDEIMDRLRMRSLRWGIIRDVVVIALGLFLLGRWVVVPVVQAFL